MTKRNYLALIGVFLSADFNEITIEGTVVKYFPANKRIRHSDMLKYAQIDEDHKSYKSVASPCLFARVALDRGNDSYWIAPLHIFKYDYL